MFLCAQCKPRDQEELGARDQPVAYPNYEFNIWLCAKHHLLSTPILPRVVVRLKLTRYTFTKMEPEQKAEETVVSAPQEQEVVAPVEEVKEPETI